MISGVVKSARETEGERTETLAGGTIEQRKRQAKRDSVPNAGGVPEVQVAKMVQLEEE